MLFWILLGLVVLVVLWLIATYNRFVKLKNRIANAWAQIDVQLRRRYDLIPNLVETVKGYARP
jgi:LemA protein